MRERSVIPHLKATIALVSMGVTSVQDDLDFINLAGILAGMKKNVKYACRPGIRSDLQGPER